MAAAHEFGSSLTRRRANGTDAREMPELARTAYAWYVQRIGHEPAPMIEDYATVVRDEEARVVEQAGHLVGLLVLHPDEDHLLLKNVAVSLDAQKLGIGTLLLHLADDRARQARLPEVRLYTNVSMTENLTYYSRHG